MSDEKARKKARDAKAAGDVVGMESAAVHSGRSGAGELGWLLPHLDTWIYVETVKMNYRGVLREVLVDGMNQPSALVMEPCYRVGEWDRSGPTAQYEMLMEGPHAVRYGTVGEIGPMHKSWPRL